MRTTSVALWLLVAALGMPQPAAGQPAQAQPAEQQPSGPGFSAPCERRPRLWRDRIKPCLQYSYWGYADQFDLPPLGSSVRASLTTQIANGMIARMVLYDYDFGDGKRIGPSQLNAHGQRRLKELARLMQTSRVHPLVVEQTPADPRLDASRRTSVLKALGALAPGVPEDWVVTGTAESVGLSGEEALEIQENLLRQTKEAATASSSAGAGMGSGWLQGGSQQGRSSGGQ
jgi:hypothetical protein